MYLDQKIFGVHSGFDVTSINGAEECHKLLFRVSSYLEEVFFIFIAYGAKLIGGVYIFDCLSQGGDKKY